MTRARVRLPPETAPSAPISRSDPSRRHRRRAAESAAPSETATRFPPPLGKRRTVSHSYRSPDDERRSRLEYTRNARTKENSIRLI